MKEQKTAQKTQIKTSKSLTSKVLIALLTITILFIESIFVLLKGFRRGIFKKQVLSNRSNLGFDIDIIIKS
ncbi:hypothetical protein [Prochlorococcus marinus]|uniref:hypothetical protein n=1 Tax=Prochlorococcus marinus TaxID=1219 RepID=UPI0022B4D03A|nr:hypothetical protein [Prochlorococcus marinus]